VPDLYGTAPYGPAGCLLTHLPTCFYDSDYFSREMRAAGYPLINLEARYWNVPITAERQVALTDVESILARTMHEGFDFGGHGLEYRDVAA
jgi:hypothetical protein